MDEGSFVSRFSDPSDVERWASALGIRDVERATRNLTGIAETAFPSELGGELFDRITSALQQSSDPDKGLNNLERFFRASRSPTALVGFFERDADALPILVKIFALSQYLADHLIRDPEAFDFLRLTDGQPVAREVLIDEICAEIRNATEEAQVLRILRAYKHRETLRIAYGDYIGNMPIETITEQLSWLADALCEAAALAAWREQTVKRGTPLTTGFTPARFTILALGKLGGIELNYSSDIDLVFLAETEGRTHAPRPIDNQEFFDRLVQQIVRLLSEKTSLGYAYRVDLRLRPYGSQGALVVNPEYALQYYDSAGRTWERQAFIKARPIAGDQEFGNQWLAQLEPWVYRRYLTRADIAGIRALKRRIESRATLAGTDATDVKHGYGGIRDVEFVIQFLQLLNGSDLPAIRLGNTLQAMARLESAGCLTSQERRLLDASYRMLRRVEHLLQIMFDHQTHTLPTEPEELQRLAVRLGYRDDKGSPARDAFRRDLQEKAHLNRRILDHLLHDAFGDQEVVAVETDLVLDPEPDEDNVMTILGRYRFADPKQAYQRLSELAREDVLFLSTRRCRHFLAAIAPRLLESIAATPNPDVTLLNLARVSESLGGKSLLWELFSYHAPSMDLCVRLCACSPYLVGILTSHPGMIDELMDSLMLDRLPSLDELDAMLHELCRGAEDIEPMLHSFKNTMHLRVGVRDVLGKEDVVDTHRALSDIAEVCVQQIVDNEFQKLVQRYGVPTMEAGPRAGEKSSFVVLALGKLGGHEPNYHSDLDVIFLFDEEGTTQSLLPSRRNQATSNRYFFNQLAQRIIQSATRLTPWGKLYEMDARLRPSGKSGVLAISLEDFETYFRDQQGQLWERQALCKARCIWGTEAARQAASEVVQRIIQQTPWTNESAAMIRDIRLRWQKDASDHNLKRGEGGTVDVEFLVQMLQLENGSRLPAILKTGTLESIDALESHGLLSHSDARALWSGYHFLRRVESGLRLLNTAARHDLPTSPQELETLAFLLKMKSGETIVERCAAVRKRHRDIFDQQFAQRDITPSHNSTAPI